MQKFEKQFLIKFTFLFCFIWMYVIFVISKKYNILLSITESNDQSVFKIKTVRRALYQNGTGRHSKDIIGQQAIVSSLIKENIRTRLAVRFNTSAPGMNGYLIVETLLKLALNTH